jgi:hypothetical protein
MEMEYEDERWIEEMHDCVLYQPSYQQSLGYFARELVICDKAL